MTAWLKNMNSSLMMRWMEARWLELLAYDPDVKGFKVGRTFLYAICGFMVLFTLWAGFTKLPTVTRGEGKVIPTSSVQKVSNLEGGILAELLANEGDIVIKDQVILRLDNVMAASSYRDAVTKSYTLLTALSRLQAELDGKDSFVVSKDVLEKAPHVALEQQQLFQRRQENVQNQLSVIDAQLIQKQQEVNDIRARMAQASRNVNLGQREYRINQPLVKRGIISELEFLEVEKKLNAAKGEMTSLQINLPRVEQGLNETKAKAETIKSTFLNQVAEELNKTRTELSTIQETSTAGKDRVQRTEVRSPVNGVIKTINYKTVGGVIQSGSEIAEIVPHDEKIRIEATVRPADIAFLRPGLLATIKITAYDFSVYGGLHATVDQISADTIQDKQGAQFYKVYLNATSQLMQKNNKPLPIIPGMTATVEIEIGKKSILSYLTKPITRIMEGSFREH
jgi:adhesin transport system membrane fusion protein